MDKIFNELSEDVLVYGHNHRIANYEKRNNKLIAQVGVIGMHNNEINKPQYTILNIKENEVKPQIRTVEYNINKLKEEIYESNILQEDRVWQNLCYYTIKEGGGLREKFIHEAQEKMLQKYHGEYPNGIEKNFVSFDDDIYMEVAKEYEKYFLL